MSDMTIRDIARIAGVSTTAVSFVLNDRPGVSSATRQRVQEIIERTGFTPNVHTRRLNLGRSLTFHVVLFWHNHDLFNQFALEILYGIFSTCKKLGYSVMFTFVDNTMDCTQVMESIRSKDCDGLILSQIDDPVFISRLQHEKIPFVCVDSHVKGDGTLPMVEVNYYDAAYQAVRFLCQKGHKEIGFMCPASPVELHASTFSGYADALRDSGLVCNPAWIASIDFSARAAGDYIERLIQRDKLPTAFLCTGDAFTIDLVHRAQSLGVRVPEDLSVISMDDIVVSHYVTPAITTMTFDKELLGSRAVDMLYAMVSGETIDPVNLISTTLIERDSVRDLTR